MKTTAMEVSVAFCGRYKCTLKFIPQCSLSNLIGQKLLAAKQITVLNECVTSIVMLIHNDLKSSGFIVIHTVTYTSCIYCWYDTQ